MWTWARPTAQGQQGSPPPALGFPATCWSSAPGVGVLERLKTVLQARLYLGNRAGGLH